ncbi:MAG: SDR family oxidoreductase, partial [Phenylobacterium sp.]
MKVQGKIIIVTGGADGIGAALCRRFAREGAAHVAVADLNGEGAAKVAAEIGGSSYAVDVSDPSAVEAMVRAVEAAHGRIDLLCQNAGVGGGEPDPDNAASAPDAVWNRAWG